MVNKYVKYLLDGLLGIVGFLVLNYVWGLIGANVPIFATIASFGFLGATIGDVLALTIAIPVAQMLTTKYAK